MGLTMTLKKIFICLLFWMPFFAFAHPHSFIKIKTRIEGNETQITGFNMVWTFDAMTTAYMYDGEDLSPKAKETSLKNLALSVIDNMKNTHYFTYFYHNHEPIRYKVVKTAEMEDKSGEAILSFDIRLSKPLPVSKDTLELMIFDPSYYVDLYWDKNTDVSLSAELAKSCHYKIVEPHPTTEQMNYAMSLSLDADPDDTLGQLFTQKVELHCLSAEKK